MRQTSRQTDEINDGNWGTLKITFKDGTATETTNHAKRGIHRCLAPQPEQRARRCRQAWQQGFPVSLEITAGAERPQIEQIIVVIGRQDPHSGPSVAGRSSGDRGRLDAGGSAAGPSRRASAPAPTSRRPSTPTAAWSPCPPARWSSASHSGPGPSACTSSRGGWRRSCRCPRPSCVTGGCR